MLTVIVFPPGLKDFSRLKDLFLLWGRITSSGKWYNLRATTELSILHKHDRDSLPFYVSKALNQRLRKGEKGKEYEDNKYEC